MSLNLNIIVCPASRKVYKVQQRVSLYLNIIVCPARRKVCLQGPATCVTVLQHTCLSSKWKVYKDQYASLYLNISVCPASGRAVYKDQQHVTEPQHNCLSRKWKVCLQGPATCVTVPQHNCLSSKWKVYKDQHTSLYLNLSVCPTLKREFTKSQQPKCITEPQQRFLSNKTQ